MKRARSWWNSKKLTAHVTMTWLAAAAAVVVTGCGESRPDFARSGATGSSALKVHLSAGTPIAGATVMVYAVNDADGEVNALVGSSGVIGIGGPTDASGDATVQITMAGYSGPIQVVASGSNLSFTDPSLAAMSSSSGAAAPTIQIPSTFLFTSYVASYNAAAATITVPVSLLTTIADAEGLAYASGLHPLHPGQKTLTQALADRDPLFVRHMASAPNTWNPGALRSTIPAALTAGPQTLNDAAFAALFDLGLASLARDTAAKAGYPVGSTAFNSISLATLLIEDVKADGVFNGKGDKGTQLSIGEQAQLALNGEYLRIPLARAVDEWIQSKSGNASGIQQQDLVATGVFTSISGDTSDLFAIAPQGLYNPTDHIPPELSVVGAGPAWLKPSVTSVTLTVSAIDPSGVGGVWFMYGTVLTPIAATANGDGTWSCVLSLPLSGALAYAIWAVDLANPSNSGKDSLDPRYKLTGSITIDGTPPTASIVTGLASYRSEQGLGLTTNASGQALVPPQYTYAAGPVNLHDGAAIYKASSRVGWNSTPKVGDLEGANPDNVPVVQYAVPYNPATDAPITTAKWKVTLSSSTTGTAAGDLWPSGSTSSAVLYDLPLSANLIPGLASLTGPATVSVTLTLGDAAGNVQDVPGGVFTFHVIGPPLAIAEDTTYPATGDLRSPYPYKIGDPRYAQLFQSGATAFLPENAVRLARYLVTNPSASSVALSLPSIPSGWSAQETWTGYATPTGLTDTGCGNPANGSVGGDTHVTAATSGFVSFAYNESQGLDTSPAQNTASGQVVVPPASGTSPGAVVLYLARPLAPGMRTFALPWNGSRFETVPSVIWVSRATSGQVCCEWDYESNPHRCLAYGYRLSETQYNAYRDLTAASEVLTGSFGLVTYGLSGTSILGEPTSSPVAIALDRTIQH